MRKITIQSIADHAGVSRGTVDRVLHNRPNVKPEIRARVLHVIEQLGYPSQDSLPPNAPRRLGVLLPGNGWFNAHLKAEWLRGFRDARSILKPLGFDITLIECETDLPHEFAAHIESMKKKGLDGLVLTAKNSPVMQNMLRQLHSASIPVVTYNSDITDCGRLCFVGQDLYQSGRVAADLVSKFVREHEEILLVAGNLEIDAHKQRIKGFEEKCRSAGIAAQRMSVIESYNEYTLTYEKILQALQRNPRLHAIYMANESVPACAEAIAQSRRQDKILVVGNDLSAATQSLLNQGVVDFIIEQNIYWQGYEPLMVLKQFFLSAQEDVESCLFTDISIISGENMKYKEIH